ncbi:MAG: hypothetical protein CL949_04510 [Erythrobacter sp.]|nr:hypothetical protein [Erythrobacter sp.]
MTDIIACRAAQRSNLNAIYDLIAKLVDADEGDRLAHAAEIEKRLGVRGHKAKDFVQFRLATDWISLLLEEGSRSFHHERLDRWREELMSDVSDGPLETDSHVIHLHLLGIHGHKLEDLLGGPLPKHTPLRLFDRLHTDIITLSILVNLANRTGTFPNCDASAPIEKCIETAELFLGTIAHLSAVEGLIVDGDTILINAAFGEANITHQWIRFSRDIPDGILSSLEGRTLSRAVEIAGLIPTGLKIEEARRSSDNDETIILKTNRFAPENCFVLNPARHLDIQEAA